MVTSFTYDQFGQGRVYSEGFAGYIATAIINSAGFPVEGWRNGIGTTNNCGGVGALPAAPVGCGGTTTTDENGNTTSSGCILCAGVELVQECSGAEFPFACEAPSIGGQFATFAGATYDAMDRSLATTLSLEVETLKQRTFTHQYDPLGRLKNRTIDSDEIVPSVPRTFSYSYNDLGGSSSRTGPDGGHTDVQLVTANRLQFIERRDDLGAVVMRADYTYFDNDIVATITYGNGQVVGYAYDGAGRVSVITHKDSSTNDVHLLLEYTYDARGLPLTITEKSGPAGDLVLDATTTFTYDRRGRLLTEVRVDGAWITYNLAYEYDPGGNRKTKRDFPADRCTKYEYDIDQPLVYATANNRLMKEQVFTNATFCIDLESETFYDYSADGNVTRITTRLPPSGGSSSAMSSGGPLVQSADILSVDDETTQAAPGGGTAQAAAGGGGFCPAGYTEYNAIRFGYAQNGQAVTIVHDEKWCVDDACGNNHDCGTGNCTSNYTITFAKEFRYNGARERYLVRNLDPNDFNVVLSEVWSDYDRDSLYGDFDPGSGSTTGSYVPGIWRSVGGIDDYLHGDMVGTLRTTTDENGLATTPRVFTAFGEKIAGPQDRHGYAGAWGYQTHAEFDFQHVGARYYNPSSGRFLQRDPIGISGGINVYSYVSSVPTAAIDPSGENPALIGIIGWLLVEAAREARRSQEKGNKDFDRDGDPGQGRPHNPDGPEGPWDWARGSKNWHRKWAKWRRCHCSCGVPLPADPHFHKDRNPG